MAAAARRPRVGGPQRTTKGGKGRRCAAVGSSGQGAERNQQMLKELQALQERVEQLERERRMTKSCPR